MSIATGGFSHLHGCNYMCLHHPGAEFPLNSKGVAEFPLIKGGRGMSQFPLIKGGRGMSQFPLIKGGRGMSRRGLKPSVA